MFIPLTTHAYFQRWGESVRQAGLGGAGSATSGSLDYFWVNPASLGRPAVWSAWAESASTWRGLTDGSSWTEGGVRVGGPLGGWSGAFGWHSRGLSDLFREEAWAGTLVWPSPLGGQEALGVAVKWMGVAFEPVWAVRGNPGLTAREVRAVSWDIGWQSRMVGGWTWSMVVRDLSQPSLSVVGEEASQPLAVQAGLLIDLDDETRLLWDPSWRAGAWQSALGVERSWRNVPLEVRAGATASAFPGHPFQMTSVTFGAGYRWWWNGASFGFQYAWVWPLSGLAGDWGNHRFGFSIQEGVGMGSPLGVGDAEARRWDMTLPPLRFPLTALQSPGEEWEERKREFSPTSSFTDRHRHALLTTVVAGTTAGEAAYQALMDRDPHALSSVALAAVGRLRYEPGGDPVTILIGAYGEAVERGTPSPEAWLALGWLRAQRGQWVSALDAYRRWSQVKTEGQTEAGTLFSMGLAALSAGEIPSADARVSELLVLAPRQSWTKELEGRVALARKEFGPALAAFEEGERLAESPVERVRLAWCQAVAHLQEGRYESFARALAVMGRIDGASAEAMELSEFRRAASRHAAASMVSEGKKFEDQLMLREALIAYQRSLEFDAGQEAVIVRVARVRERMAEQIEAHARRAEEATSALNLEQALVEWKLVLSADPQHAGALAAVEKLYGALLAQADERAAEGVWKESLRLYHVLEDAWPGRAELPDRRKAVRSRFAERARSSESIEGFAAARRVWQEFLRLEPEDREASQEVKRLAEAGRTHATGYMEEAAALYRKGQIVAALLMADRALRSEPEWEEALSFKHRTQQEKERLVSEWLGEAREALRRHQENRAREWYQKVLGVEPGHPEALGGVKAAAEQSGRRLAKLFASAQEADIKLEPEEALKSVEQVLNAVPDHAEATALRLRLKERMERARTSKVQVDQLRLKGDIAYGQGKVAEAVQLWEQAVQLDYYSKDLRRKIEGAKQEINK